MYAKKYYEDVFALQQSGEYADDIKFHKRELEKERKKLQTEKLEYNQWLREEARDEMLMERITDAVHALPRLDPPCGRSLKASKACDYAWILTFGDAHYGAEFEIRGLYDEIINAYNPEIFEQRMEDLLARTIDIIKKEKITDLYVFDLGDQIDPFTAVFIQKFS